MLKISLCVIIYSLFFTLNVICQSQQLSDTLVFTCDDAIRTAIEGSYTIQSHKLEREASKYNYSYNKAMFKPRLDLNLNAPSWDESVQPVLQADGLPVYNSYGMLKAGADLTFTYVLPTGGNLSLSSLMYRGNESTYLMQYDSTLRRNMFYSQFQLWFRQPVFVKNQLRENLQEAKLKYEKSSCFFTRMQMDIVYEVTRSFYMLLRASREVEINTEKYANSEEFLRIATLKSKGGRVALGDVLSAEVQVAQNKALLLRSINNLENEKDRFKQLIGIGLEKNISVKSNYDYKVIIADPQKALDEALKNRMELKEGQADIELQQIEIDRAKRERKIKGSINAFYSLNGISNITSSSTSQLANSSFDDLNKRPANRSIMFTLSIPIVDWGRGRSKINEATYRMQQKKLGLENQEIDIKREINEILRSLNELSAQIEMHKKNLDRARESYRINQRRFENGDISNQELIMEQERLTNIQMDYLDAFIGYQLTVNNLKRKTMWDFENNQSYLIDDETKPND